MDERRGARAERPASCSLSPPCDAVSMTTVVSRVTPSDVTMALCCVSHKVFPTGVHYHLCVLGGGKLLQMFFDVKFNQHVELNYLSVSLKVVKSISVSSISALGVVSSL